MGDTAKRRHSLTDPAREALQAIFAEPPGVGLGPFLVFIDEGWGLEQILRAVEMRARDVWPLQRPVVKRWVNLRVWLWLPELRRKDPTDYPMIDLASGVLDALVRASVLNDRSQVKGLWTWIDAHRRELPPAVSVQVVWM